ncbi:GIY-YIG nuclease family protein [Hoeflea alexandrii]|uniref:GIY-YIG nuclease family protein n=1 Tax=Hoeflea alexandrii TaxID=288436 RepID=UPI0022AFBE89|nr:GIY-YIG nuclease family protein [Hoeflea alexandrii]MCZ4288475.1 GIY-YIG nuclease family protein [Hoeflea alexandrii]
MFEFNDFLRRIDLDPARIRLLRHDTRGVAAWRRGREVSFGCFASFQKKTNSPYGGASVACHFLPGPSLDDGSATALFIGITRIIDRWDWDEVRMPRIIDAEMIKTERGRLDIEAFDLEWLDAGHDFAERMLVKWGTGTRAWSQWTARNSKEILELRLQAQEPPFPGFSGFISRIRDLPTFPQSWVNALESVRGIYLLVTDGGEQYVGSAIGVDGLMGRWRSYFANGHGGNVLLREGGYRDYSVSILEVASPDMAPEDILAREAFWKTKLGARAHGLNAN